MNNIVSIIIPTYGGGEFLHRSITSVLNQTYKNIEVIVVDDNGLGTPAQLSTAKAVTPFFADPRVKYVCHENNINGSAARNTGVKNSRGAYIALLDDDDEFYPEKIEKQIKALIENPECGLTYCSADRMCGDRLVGRDLVHSSNNYLFDLMMHNQHIQTSSVMLRREVWDAVGGFDESFKRHQDWEFMARLSKATKFLPIDFVGYRYYIVQRNRPQDPVRMKELRLYYLKKMEPVISILTDKQQKEIYFHNRMAVAFEFLKRKRFADFMKEYSEIAPGIYGIKYLVRRIYKIIRKQSE